MTRVDPYFPIGTESIEYVRGWGFKLEQLKERPIQVLGLRETFYERFLSPAPMSQQPDIRKDWEEFGEFYRYFHNQYQVEYSGEKWKRVYKDSCGFTIFEKLK